MGRTDGQTDGRTDRRTDGQTYGTDRGNTLCPSATLRIGGGIKSDEVSVLSRMNIHCVLKKQEFCGCGVSPACALSKNRAKHLNRHPSHYSS